MRCKVGRRVSALRGREYAAELGQQHNYIPEFIVRLENGVHLILETKGYDVLEEIKTHAALRWVDAVNADGRHGDWRYEIVHEMNAISSLLG